jgi:uncharacterized protein (DUF305 family)
MKTLVITTIVAMVVGIGIGRLIWGHQSMNSSQPGTHRMADGTMMVNNHSDDGSSEMHDMMGGMMSGLQGKTGDTFDKAFLSGMIIHHEGAVAMAQAVLKTSKRPELIKLANDIIAAQTKEIDMMKQWQTQWFK